MRGVVGDIILLDGVLHLGFEFSHLDQDADGFLHLGVGLGLLNSLACRSREGTAALAAETPQVKGATIGAGDAFGGHSAFRTVDVVSGHVCAAEGAVFHEFVPTYGTYLIVRLDGRTTKRTGGKCHVLPDVDRHVSHFASAFVGSDSCLLFWGFVHSVFHC